MDRFRAARKDGKRGVRMICAIMPARNEDWIIGWSARALLMWCDHLVVLDHASTDDTLAILHQVAWEHPRRVTVMHESSPVWEEMRHRQLLLDTARAKGATHIVTIDADEILTGDLLPSIRDMIYACPAQATMQLPWLCLRDSLQQVHVDGVWGNQHASMAFRDAPGLGWNSAARGGYDFHHREPMGRPFEAYWPVGRKSGLLHLQFVDSFRLRAKQALYQATEVLRWPGRETPDQVRRKYSLTVYGKDGPPAEYGDLRTAPAAWLEWYKPLIKYYRPMTMPWQAIELRRLVAEHGMERFAGLDFFEIV